MQVNIIYKKYRIDLNIWEEKIKVFFFFIYRYSLWKKGKTRIRYTLFVRDKTKANYIESPYLQPIIKISKEDFMQKYNGNKYLLPAGYEVE